MVLRLSEAAELTGRSRQTLTNWVENGVLPAKKINGTYYVSKTAVESMLSVLDNLEAARAKIKALQEEYLMQKEGINFMIDVERLEHDKVRHLSVCVNSGIKTRFFEIIVRMFGEIGELTKSEVEVLIEVLNGEDMSDIAQERKSTRERIRQLAEKAIRKSCELKKFAEMVKTIEDKDNEISTLKNELAVVKRLVYKKAASEVEVTLNEDEKRVMSMDKYELNKLLSKKLSNEDLSVRALNCLYCFKNVKGEHMPIKTVGDLCRVTKKEYLIQRNAGKKTMTEIENFLNSLGLSWDIDIDKILEVKL